MHYDKRKTVNMQSGRTKVKSKQNLIHIIQLCGRKKGMLYITVSKKKTKMQISILYITSFNPQNLRNFIKKVAKISITQNIIELICQNNRILLFFDIPQILQA